MTIPAEKNATRVETRIRSYELTHAAHQSKVDEIASLLNPIRSAMTMVKQRKIAQLKENGYTRKLKAADYDDLEFRCGFDGLFSRRRWKSIEIPVDAALATWRAKAVRIGRTHIRELDDADEERHRLYRLNEAGRFWDVEGLAEYILARNPFPVFRFTRTIHNDGIVLAHKKNGGSAFDYWLEIRGFTSHDISIPIVNNPYVLEKFSEAHKVSTTAKIVIDRDGDLHIHQPMEFANPPTRKIGDTLGIDWGLVNTISTSDGRTLGRDLYPWLKKIDAQVTQLQSRLQRQGMKPYQSTRFRRFQHRIVATVKNKLGEILNSLADEDIRAFIVESLDFRGTKLGRKLNRIITRAGRAEMSRRMREMPERYGIEIVEVNPAYTSQECAECHYTHKTNRAGERFVCGFCGHSAHADVNAARNIRFRGENPHLFGRFDTKGKILSTLALLHEASIRRRLQYGYS